MNDPVDIALIAERLDVERQTVDMWRFRQLLPEATYPQLSHPVWEWEIIAEWAEDTGRI